jgi:hypothetical protein
VSAAPDPSGRHDDLEAGGLAFLVPDDARALDADREAYLRELAELQGAARPEDPQPAMTPPRSLLARVGRTRRWQAYGLSGPLVTAVLLVVALVGSLMTVLAPRNAPAPAARPLAATGTRPPGEVGGLLPDATLSVGPVEISARGMRPTVLLFIPTDCTDCLTVVSAVLLQVRSHRLHLMLVGPPAQHDQLADLDRHGAGGQATLALDPSGELDRVYGQDRPTVVVVAADGIVTAIDSGLTRSVELDPELFNALRAV